MTRRVGVASISGEFAELKAAIGQEVGLVKFPASRPPYRTFLANDTHLWVQRVPAWTAEVAIGVSQAICDLRERHGLTQKALAARVGTTQSVIARLEDADYEGHSLRMLARIAAAVGEHVTIAFSGETERTVA